MDETKKINRSLMALIKTISTYVINAQSNQMKMHILLHRDTVYLKKIQTNHRNYEAFKYSFNKTENFNLWKCS